jgi:hypothetical protein
MKEIFYFIGSFHRMLSQYKICLLCLFREGMSDTIEVAKETEELLNEVLTKLDRLEELCKRDFKKGYYK